MTPNERELILGVAGELKAADRSAIDTEAERLIRSEVASQPNAAYLLTQRVIVLQLALRQAQARLDELEEKSRTGGSFLGGAAGAGPAVHGYPGPQSAEPPSASAGGGVGSFLKTAAAAAAGTIGGQLIFDGLRHLAAGHWGGIGDGGVLGGSGMGGFLPGGSRPAEPDYQPDSGDIRRDQDWGGGGEFGSDSTDDVEQVEDLEAEPEEEDTDDQDDWDEDESDDTDAADGGDGW